MIESVAGLPDGWTVCDGGGTTPNLQDRFILGAGGSKTDETGSVYGTTGGHWDGMVLGHFHGGETFAIKSWSKHTGAIRGISEAFNDGGGTADGLFAASKPDPRLSATNARYADDGNCGTVLLDLGDWHTNTHQHSLNTWGEPYDNNSYVYPSNENIPTAWSQIGVGMDNNRNVGSLNSNPKGANIPPYYKLYFIKFGAT